MNQYNPGEGVQLHGRISPKEKSTNSGFDIMRDDIITLAERKR